jgi:sensor histidine kinase YesM
MARKTFFKTAQRFFLLNCAAAIVVVCIEAATADWSAALTFESILDAFVYSNCIGTLTGCVVILGVPAWREYNPFFRFVFLTAAILGATLLGIAAANIILALFNTESSGRYSVLSGQSFLFAFVIAFIFGFSTYVHELSQAGLVKAREQLRQREVDVAQAETLATEAQLASLESRLQPHFLFNTLNLIAALIREDAQQAEETVEKLARLLRYSLDMNNNRLVEFAQELKITRDYLEIERVRFGERLQFHVESDERFGKVRVPPFTLQTLAENSIKHVASKRSGAVNIWISARRTDNLFTVEVSDDGAGFTTNDIIENHGLDNLQKRLTKIFAENAVFEVIENTGRGGCVRISLPFNSEK